MNDWLEFLALEPDDSRHWDIRFAAVTCHIANLWRKTALQAEDVFPALAPPAPRRRGFRTPEEAHAYARQAFGRFDGRGP